MGLTATIKEWYLKTLPGMNNLVEDLDLKNKWVEIAQNCRFEEEPGAVDKRAPMTYYNTTTLGSGAFGMTGLFRYYTSGGDAEFISVHDTSAYTGTATPIRTSLTAGKRSSFVTYKDLLYGCNGSDNIWVYDGSDDVTWEMGACKIVVSTATGSLDSTAAYSYQVAITVSGATHICGAISNPITTSTSGAMEVTNIPLGPAGTTNRILYRTEGGDAPSTHGNYDIVATLADNTTTIYTDTIGDGSLGATVGAITDDQPKGAELRIHRERMFITRDPDSPSKIYYSNTYLPHFIQQTTNLDYMDISPEDNDEISGIPIQLGTMICIKKNTIRKLHIASPTSGADPTTWYADDPLAWNGSPAPWSITQTPLGIVFLGWDHWYLFDGAGARPIIDEFDTKEILDANYQDTVGFYHKGIMLAAYTDKTAANQYHDRVMRYNFKRKALSFDVWTSDTIVGPNCFASRSGDDETGELYYGDSQQAYILKDKEAEDSYRLRTKAECLAGTTTGSFIGGTQAVPYITIGSIDAAQAIPDNIIIFWDNPTTTPGSDWTEITSTYDGRFIQIGATTATAAASGHTHTVSGNLDSTTPTQANSGDQGSTGGLLFGHGHTFSGTSSSGTPEPRHVKFRMFKSSSAAATEFPDGAIVMWDQEEPPTGWQDLTTNWGYYVQCGSANLSPWREGSSHDHTWSATSSAGPDDDGQGSGAGGDCAADTHTHGVTGTSNAADLFDWELKNVQLHMIKKVGESDTWDGTNQYVMCCTATTATPTNWAAVSTYNGRYLKCGTAVASTGAAASASHEHSNNSGVSAENAAAFGGTYHRTQCLIDHTHTHSDATGAAGSAVNPANVSFPLFKYHLGKMRDYNAASTVSATGGTWTSPAQEINAETLSKMFWNEDIDDAVNDDVIFETRTGATLAACTAAAWHATTLTNPNGSPIGSDADIWLQYKVEFTCADSTVTNPRIYFSDGYVTKYTYSAGATSAETSVNFRYGVGFRNFQAPMMDKIFKKIMTVHEGVAGSFAVEWETENTTTSNTFTVDLTVYSKHWESFFPSTAFGKEINLTVYKNDLYNFRLSEVKGLYSPMPVIR